MEIPKLDAGDPDPIRFEEIKMRNQKLAANNATMLVFPVHADHIESSKKVDDAFDVIDMGRGRKRYIPKGK